MLEDKIRSLGTILTVWAHPDDESWCAAGVIAAAATGGQRVVCVTATRGEKGVQDETRWPAAELGKIRQNELEQSLKILGVRKHHWLGYIDGECKDISDGQASAKIRAIVESVRPDTVLTFGPLGSTGHPDHKAVSHWTAAALKSASLKKPAKLYYVADSKERYETYGRKLDAAFNVYFNLDAPPLIREADMDLCYRLPKAVLDKKLKALRAQPSQMGRIFASGQGATLRKTAALECFVLAERYNQALAVSAKS